MINKKAYAKINLGLQVKNKRNDGYHNLKMYLLMIDLYDELEFSLNDKLTITGDVGFANLEDNLIYKTAKIIKNKYNIKQGANIKLVKNIRIGAGLAGGSTDAATTIKGLNELWNLNLSLTEMLAIAEMIGSDVPFCLMEKPAIVEGKGEIITPHPFQLDMTFILVFPNFVCSTTKIFNAHKIVKDNIRFEKLLNSLKKKDIKEIGINLFNDLETTVDEVMINNNHNIKKIKETLIKAGSFGAVMTGSGSTVYGITDTYEKAETIAKNLEKTFLKDSIIIAKNIKN